MLELGAEERRLLATFLLSLTKMGKTDAVRLVLTIQSILPATLHELASSGDAAPFADILARGTASRVEELETEVAAGTGMERIRRFVFQSTKADRFTASDVEVGAKVSRATAVSGLPDLLRRKKVKRVRRGLYAKC
jgi:hypothetical protein